MDSTTPPSFAFRRGRVTVRLILFGLMPILMIAMLVGSPYLILNFHMWDGVVGLLMMPVLAVFGTAAAITLSRTVAVIREHAPAFAVTRHGIIDNASAYCLGEIAWEEIDRIWVLASVIPISRLWRKRQPKSVKYLAIRLKDAYDLRRLPRPIAAALRIEWRRYQHRLVLILESDLDAPVASILRQLNEFYVAAGRPGSTEAASE